MMERDYFVASPNATVCELFVSFCFVSFRFVCVTRRWRGGYRTYETYEMLITICMYVFARVDTLFFKVIIGNYISKLDTSSTTLRWTRVVTHRINRNFSTGWCTFTIQNGDCPIKSSIFSHDVHGFSHDFLIKSSICIGDHWGSPASTLSWHRSVSPPTGYRCDWRTATLYQVRRSTGRIKCQSRNGLSQLITDNIYIYIII